MRQYRRPLLLPATFFIVLLAVTVLLALIGDSQTPGVQAAAPQAVTYLLIDTDTTWGPGVVNVGADVVITNGATLTVTPGTEVRLSNGGVEYPGGVSDLTEIIVLNGRLVADDAAGGAVMSSPTITFTAESPDESWYGIRILGSGADGESLLRHLLIENVVQNLYIENASPTVAYNTICGARGADGDDGSNGLDGIDGPDATNTVAPVGQDGVAAGPGEDGQIGQAAYGIYIAGANSAPLITHNTICDIRGGDGGRGGNGGKGGSGGAGYHGTTGDGAAGGLGAMGGLGGNGGDAGYAVGIYVKGAAPVLEANLIYEIAGGRGGDGGVGGAGGDGGAGGHGEASPGFTAYGGGGNYGGAGGAGGDAGDNGPAWGIFIVGDAAPVVRDNEIYAVIGGSGGPAGGNGGNGGNGAAGGEGSGQVASGAVGAGGAGGAGGRSGAGGAGGRGGEATGVFIAAEAQAQVRHNRVWWIEGGLGGLGGNPGSGGMGGAGGKGSIYAPGGSGVDGGSGGAHDPGGDGGVGGLAVGIQDLSAASTVSHNTLFGIYGGEGGTGGSGGNLFTFAGMGGAGGLLDDPTLGLGHCAGNGGNGGRGADDGAGGDGGQGIGILSRSSAGIANNVIYGIGGGAGGSGSLYGQAGHGGTGGNGGSALSVGCGGKGGDGGNGGNGGAGGSAGYGIAVYIEGVTAAPDIVNNTLDRLDLGSIGIPAAGGTAGSGGLLGYGAGGGEDGILGASGVAGIEGDPGVEGRTAGLYFTDQAKGQVYNNIVVRTVYTDTEYFVGTANNSYGIWVGTGSGPLTLDYNDVWNWQTNYHGVLTGTHDLHADPLFANVLCMDCEDFGLRVGSPCLDVADAAHAPADDHDGVLRPQDGDLDGTPGADMGAYEYISFHVYLPLALRQ